MTIIIKIAVFLLGMCLSVQLIAAFLGIIDLWYTIKTAYPMVIRKIVLWGAIIAALALLLGDFYRPAFLWGLFAFVIFYIGTYFGTKLLIKWNTRLIESGR